jgi:hypothetical protein
MQMRKRSIAIALALMMIGVLIAGPSIRSVNAQTGEILTAAVVQGDCTQPGAPVAQLRELQPGAQSIAGTPVSTSFTTIDLGLLDLAAGGYAITVSSGTGMVACGEMVAPTGNDMFVGIREANTSGYSGTAWLHARDAQTQVSLFIAQGLGGGAGTDGPPGPPEPPVEPTPAGPQPPSEPTPAGPGPEPTPQAPVGGTTYTSPSYGYSLTYDATWQVEEESSEPGQNGPVDYLALTNGLSFLEILGVPTGQPISALDCRTFWENNWRENAQISNLVPRAGADGAPIQGGDASFAYSAFDFDFTPQGGQPIQLAVWIGCYQIPGQPAVITVLDQIPQRAFDQQLPALEAILATIQLP